MPQSDPTAPLCYRCKYRAPVPGDAHSACRAPPWSAPGAAGAALVLVAIGNGFDVPVRGAPGGRVRVRFDPHGVQNAWAIYPTNFDPIWLRECSLHEPLPVAAEKESADGR